MTAIAAVLRVLTPTPGQILRALSAPQALTDTAGPGALVLAVAGGLAWLVWTWGALGLLLTAAGALPGALGWVARLLQRAVLPAGARRTAAVALGLGVVLQAPLAGAAPAAPTGSSAAVVEPVVAEPVVPDWPTGSPDTTGAPTAQHVVVRGDCLWDIAAGHLRPAGGRPPTAAEVAGAVAAWWSANRGVMGDDPDLLLPGQVLTPPVTP
jgi:nucleoid-associated protein YgaU